MNHSSIIFAKYLSDLEMVALVSDEALIKKMLLFEITLANAQARLKMIPKRAAREISSVLTKVKINPDDLTDSTLSDGIPVIELLSITKGNLSKESKEWLHYHATSQDTMDTAQVLIVRDATSLIKERTEALIRQLEKIRKKFGNIPCMARTRGQLAIPIKFGIKIDAWIIPLRRQMQRIQEYSQRLFCVQLGGAAGDLQAFAGKGMALSKELAKELKLNASESWHSQRDVFCELTNWLAIHAGILGKMGADILVMSQAEVGELTENPNGGNSSSMTHKNNPVLSESLVALASINANAQALQLQSLVHRNERDGSALILEWNNIPQMLIHSAVSLHHAQSICKTMIVHTDAMKKNVEAFRTKYENR
jgi:3-carboxy-cis,cis-muconate cycloisomerase